MTELSTATAGVLCMILQGLSMNAQLTIGKVLEEWKYPFFRIVALTTVVVAPALGLWLWRTGAPVPEVRVWKWLFGRGFFGATNFLFLLMAVRMGAGTGDVAALASINTVVAALLGFMFLGERLTPYHGIALVCCIGGAVLIAQPGFIFGDDSETSSNAWQGHALALIGGGTQAGIAISSRKTGDTPVSWLSLAACVYFSVFIFVLAPTPLLQDHTLDCFTEAPWSTLGWFAAVVVTSSTNTVCSSAGSQWCAAAVSATVGTASRMIWGYLAQVFIFGESVTLLTVIGAVLMLSGVVTMALVRTAPQALKQLAEPGVEVGLDNNEINEDETESIISFFATEFAVQSPHSAPPMRMRRKSDMVDGAASAQRIGATAA